MIITISGTPGSGKTAVARILAKKMGYELIELNDFIDEHKLWSGKENGSKLVDVKKLKKAARKTLQKGDLIVEGHLSHFLMADFCIVLRCDPSVLERRLKKKRWPVRKVKENVEAELIDVILAEALENKNIKKLIELDTTNLSPEKSAEKIIRLIKKGRPHRENVRWLKKYEKHLK